MVRKASSRGDVARSTIVASVETNVGEFSPTSERQVSATEAL